MTRTALVLGAGPTGCIAAKELHDAGWDVTIWSQAAPTIPSGAFYYHKLPRSIAERVKPAEIQVCSMGTKAMYEFKQWGMTYSSSYPVGYRTGEKRHAETRLGWWPSQEIQTRLLSGISFKAMTITAHSQVVNNRLANQYTLVVLTFPLQDFKPFRTYPTPIARVPIREVVEVFQFQPEPSQFFYDGLTDGNHKGLVRIASPPADFRLGQCYLELTRSSHLATAFWPERTTYIQEIHPCQFSIWPSDTLAGNVLVAGRVALGDADYLASDVIENLKPYTEQGDG